VSKSTESLARQEAGSTRLIASGASDTLTDTRVEPAISIVRPKKIRRKSAREKFSLWLHPSGRWCKKISRYGITKWFYFGTDKQAALDEWLRVKDYLLNGKEPPPKDQPSDVATIKFVCDSFLSHKEQQRDNGEIQPRTFDELYAACRRLAEALGRGRLVSDLRPEDFAELRKQLARTRGAVALGNEIQRVRSVFKFAFEDGIIDAPVRFGRGFAKPSAKVVRIERARKGARDLQAHQVRAIIEMAGVPLKAMVLLAANAGFGNNDIGTLPLDAVDLEGGWISYARPKTGITRRAKLWPETIAALKNAIADRPAPKERAHAGLVFLTTRGAPWAKGQAGNDPVGGEFKKLLVDLNFHRDGIGFYSLRRTFETVAGDSLDQIAVDVVMGHSPAANDMAAVYRQRVNDQRLVVVAEYVRLWLFPPEPVAK
jgi:integrase